MYRNPQRTISGGSDLFAEPLSPPANSRVQRQNRADDPSEFSPGLLDLHAFDTELIPEMPVSGMIDAPSMYRSSRGQSFDNSEPYYEASKLGSRPRVCQRTML